MPEKKKKPEKRAVSFGRVSYAPGLYSYRIPPPQEAQSRPREATIRPVAASRLASRHPETPWEAETPTVHEQRPSVSLFDRQLAAYVRSIQAKTQRIQEKRALRSFLKELSESQSSYMGLFRKLPDKEVVSSTETPRRKYFTTPRTDWRQKLQDTAEENERKARKYFKEHDELTGDICCCPMFTSHVLFPEQYESRRYFGFWKRHDEAPETSRAPSVEEIGGSPKMEILRNSKND